MRPQTYRSRDRQTAPNMTCRAAAKNITSLCQSKFIYSRDPQRILRNKYFLFRMQQDSDGSASGRGVWVPDSRISPGGCLRYWAKHPGRKLRPNGRRYPPHHKWDQRSWPATLTGWFNPANFTYLCFLSQVVRVAQRCTEALELGVARTDDVAERPSVWEQLDMAQEVMAQGYLLKKKRVGGGQGHHWVTRWFVLRADDCLYSFKSENVRVPCYCWSSQPFCHVRTCDPAGPCCCPGVLWGRWRTGRLLAPSLASVSRSRGRGWTPGPAASGWRPRWRQSSPSGRKCSPSLPTSGARKWVRLSNLSIQSSVKPGNCIENFRFHLSDQTFIKFEKLSFPRTFCIWFILYISLSSPLISLPQDDVWLEVSRQRSSLPASAHASPDCRGHLHQFTGGSWLRQLLVLVDGCLYIYSDIEPDAPAIGESLPTIE